MTKPKPSAQVTHWTDRKHSELTLCGGLARERKTVNRGTMAMCVQCNKWLAFANQNASRKGEMGFSSEG